VQEIFSLIRKIHEEEKVAILLVEQNARKALASASQGYVLELGRIAMEGRASELAVDPRVVAAYLGGRSCG
jgi:branched-chain amino acid transport system ATP-binding protein